MNELITRLQSLYPSLKFNASDSFYWSPLNKQIYFKVGSSHELDKWSLIHEVGHALLDHTSYQSDYMLLKMEIEAWQKAKEVGHALDIKIDDNHIQNCLDTYRDWLYRRSICPKCSNKSIQQSDLDYYRCFNCHMRWRVTRSRFCRTYRIKDQVELQPVFI